MILNRPRSTVFGNNRNPVKDNPTCMAEEL